jgi:hypothetical protein
MTMGMVLVASLTAPAPDPAAATTITSTLFAHQVRGERRQALIPAFGKAQFEGDVLALYIAALLQSLREGVPQPGA